MNKKFALNFYLAFIFVGLFSIDLYAQKDSIFINSNDYLDVKSFPIDNDFLETPTIEFDDSGLLLIQPTEFTKDYTFKYLTYDPVRDPKRLMYSTGLYVGASVSAFGLLWVLPESFTNWDKDEIKEEGFFNKWKENVKAGPVMDGDDWFLNWVTHPWAGAVYYMSARGSGFKKWESFGYSVFMSTLFWEYGVEAFAEIPSWQDLVITPVVGSIIGEQFFRWKGNIIRNERKVLGSRFLGGTSLFLMDPFNEILDGIIGYKTKNNVQTYSTFAPVDFDITTGKSIWGMQVVVVF
ncbi:MAG: DUF3943 domain-containing protein [Bacteroidota bacterium]